MALSIFAVLVSPCSKTRRWSQCSAFWFNSCPLRLKVLNVRWAMYLIFNGHFNFNITRFGGKLFYDWNIHSKLLLVALWTNDDSVNVGWVAGERMLVTNIVLKKPGKVESISPTWGKSLRFLGHLVRVIIIVILIASCFFLWHAWPGWIRNREAGKNTIKQKLKHYHFLSI